MMTQAQQKKFSRIQDRIEELLESDVNGMVLLKNTVQNAAPSFMGMMQGKAPSVDVLQSVAINLLAVVLASTQDINNSEIPNN